MIENARYPNRCIAPDCKKIIEVDIGEFHDNHPLNRPETNESEYRRLFHDTKSIENLINEIKEKVCPVVTFDIMNKDETGCCMTFGHREYANPEKSANDWIAERLKYFPNDIKKNGYHVVRNEKYYTSDNLALKAAELLQDIVDKEKL